MNDVLIFAEDPGAVNFLAPLSKELSLHQLSSVVLASGLAIAQLERRKIAFDKVDTDADCSSIITCFRPKVIIAGTAENPKTIALSLFMEGKRQLIPTIGVVDMVVNAAGRFRGEGIQPLACAPDYIMVPDYETKNAFELINFPADNIFIIGYPQLDFIQSKKVEFTNLNIVELKRSLLTCEDNSKPVVVFIAEPRSLMNPALSLRNTNYRLSGREGSDFRTHIVLEEVLDALERTHLNSHFVVRLHPKNTLAEFRDYRDEVDQFSADGDPLELLWTADLVIGMTSMLVQESVWLGKRTIAVLPEELDRTRLSVLSNGEVRVVERKEHLIEVMQEFKEDIWPTKLFETGGTIRATAQMVAVIQRLLNRV